MWLGGSTIGIPSSMMIQSAMALCGAQKPAFYDGSLLQSSEPEVNELRAIVNGWRTIESSGKKVLPAEYLWHVLYFLFPTRMQFNLRNDGQTGSLN